MTMPSLQTVPESEAEDDRRSALAIDMDAFIPAALTNLAQKITATASATYRPRFGVGITDWRVIALLAAEPWIAPVQICESTGLDKAAVSRALRDLLAEGLIEARAGDSNRRRVPVALTAKGLAVHDRIVGLALERQERLLEGFSAEERAQLRDFIVRMRRRVETIKASD
ncbi:DNA-binding MarR family transcriptional regulator [Roseiarcus fermentans]|uniref:DNA-binding MarR family transcriptional regulator n=1 Tax=Roseiarcus fermentans TaxID=1473586 RepID=A0A366EL07_9HYPH|nr:MarR family transcriptional regulator [Roseiarcus fermentans]RBP03097.1 DNA-binding MarR family transcriptional regulator [Roseiarcus fermentans]